MSELIKINSFNKDVLFDELKWCDILHKLNFNSFGGALYIEDGDFYLEYGKIPISLFTDEITDDVNGWNNFYYVSIRQTHRMYGYLFDILKEDVDVIVQRMISFFTYNNMGDIVGTDYLKPLGSSLVVIVKLLN